MHFPLHKSVQASQDSNSFVRLDLTRETEIPLPPHVGAFGVERRYHIHEGIDLYAAAGDPVYALEPGIVVARGPFTGPKAGMPWWLDTEFILVEGASGVLCYGEIQVVQPLQPGQTVGEGALLGHIATVLAKDKGRPRNMLHFECYAPGTRWPCGGWSLGQPVPENLQDPTHLLLEAAGLRP